MGSLLGLFALFFAKRSILGSEDPGMCGVIKSLETDSATKFHKDADSGGGGDVARGREGGEAESSGGREAGAGTGAAWHGNVLLDERGAAEVRLPAGFVGEVRLVVFLLLFLIRTVLTLSSRRLLCCSRSPLDEVFPPSSISRRLGFLSLLVPSSLARDLVSGTLHT